jgi:hypothetical protein
MILPRFMENHVCLIIQISPSPPTKKTPLVGVFFVGVDGGAAWNLCKPPYERNHEDVIEGGLPRAQRGCSKSLHLRHKRAIKKISFLLFRNEKFLFDFVDEKWIFSNTE